MFPRSGIRHAVRTPPKTILMQFTCMNTELEELDEIFLRNIFQWKMSRNHRATIDWL